MALGMIEVYGFATAVVAADAAAKAADVRVVAIDRNKPANAETCEVPLCMTVKLEGEVSAVEEAMKAGIAEAKQRGLYLTSHLISRMGEGTEKMAAINALGRDPLRNI